MILAVQQLKTVIWTIPFLFFLLSIFALLISFGKYGSFGNIAHAHIWYKSSNGYSNRPLPIMEIIHFVMDNLSIKITLIIFLFVILKYSINLPALTLESNYCRSKCIHWYIYMTRWRKQEVKNSKSITGSNRGLCVRSIFRTCQCISMVICLRNKLKN